MRKRMLLAAGAVGVLASGALGATVKISTDAYQMDAWGPGQGGALVAEADAFGTFYTFCIELGEGIRPGRTYDYEISTEVKDRGGAGPKALASETAWLYKQFRTGAGSLFAMDSKDDARDLQIALWYLQGELSQDYADLTTGAQALVDAATTISREGLYGVRVMNLYDTATGDGQQDQLVLVPLPALPALAGAGLAPVVLRRRRS